MPADRLLHPRLGHSAKVTALSDLEFRVWLTYQLAADDYGVMRLSSVTIQACDDSLAARPAKQIDAALKRLVLVGLVRTFDHQGRTYAYQPTWQNYQRVKHPRDTMQPAPPVEQCTPATQKLIANHPSYRSEELPQDFGNISETFSEEISEIGSLARARTRETANGLRLTANGLQGVQGEALPMDAWARELVNLYPPQGRCGWNLVERPLFSAVTAGPLTPDRHWEAMKARLEEHKRSHQWRVKGMIPRLDKWLRDGLYLQELPESAPVADQLTAKTNRTLAAGAEVLGRKPA